MSVDNPAEVAARLRKANRLVDVLAPMNLSGDDVRLLAEVGAPVLGDVERQAGVRPASAETWETVAVLVEERRRLLAWARTQVPADPFSAFG